MTKNVQPGAIVNLINNGEGADHLKTFQAMMQDAERIIICVAYFKMSGYALLASSLGKLMRSQVETLFFIGTDHYLTEPDALKALFAELRMNRAGRAFLVQGNRNSFHPKLYFAQKKDIAEAMIGSANVTRGGLTSNTEASVHVVMPNGGDLCRKVESFLFDLDRDESAKPLDDITILQYEARYDIYHKYKKEGERKAKKEIAGLFELDEEKLQKYLAEYLADPDETDNRKARAEDYKQARKALDKLADMNPFVQKRFEVLYESLVGAKNVRRLWHSGSVFRHKSKVLAHGRRVTSLVRILRDNISSSPGDIYRIAGDSTEDIPGIGPNIITEILNTFAPDRFAVLNSNPLGSLQKLGFKRYPAAPSFKPETYAEYCELLQLLRRRCKLKTLGEVDHFLNYIYWRYVKCS